MDRDPLVNASGQVTGAQCREAMLETERIGDEEECFFRDHLLAVHPRTVQPENRERRAEALRHDGSAPPEA